MWTNIRWGVLYKNDATHCMFNKLKGRRSQCDIFMTMRWRLLSPGPRHGDPRGQAAAPRHAGDKSSGYQGNRVSHWGAAAESTGMWLLWWWRRDPSYMKTPLPCAWIDYWTHILGTKGKHGSLGQMCCLKGLLISCLDCQLSDYVETQIIYGRL